MFHVWAHRSGIDLIMPLNTIIEVIFYRGGVMAVLIFIPSTIFFEVILPILIFLEPNTFRKTELGNDLLQIKYRSSIVNC